MSLNRALQVFLRCRGRPVHYREENRTVVARAWITPCTGSRSALAVDLAGAAEENRYIYISAKPDRPPVVGTPVYAGGKSYRVEQSGQVEAGNALSYGWAILVREEDAECES